jgi:hypothetical protein
VLLPILPAPSYPSYEARMEDLTLKDVPARLANLILLLCEGEGEERV